jgi:hypothetical protein
MTTTNRIESKVSASTPLTWSAPGDHLDYRWEQRHRPRVGSRLNVTAQQRQLSRAEDA